MQALNALVFLYKQVLQIDLGRLDHVRARRPARLPVVLSRSEVRTLLEQVQGGDGLFRYGIQSAKVNIGFSAGRTVRIARFRSAYHLAGQFITFPVRAGPAWRVPQEAPAHNIRCARIVSTAGPRVEFAQLRATFNERVVQRCSTCHNGKQHSLRGATVGGSRRKEAMACPVPRPGGTRRGTCSQANVQQPVVDAAQPKVTMGNWLRARGNLARSLAPA
jgi:hypothetical protein